jgi:predicted GIY-YIG superfamily endonuclease
MSKNPDFTKTVIYIIYCKDPDITDCYVGSTTDFYHRKASHISCCCNSKVASYDDDKYEFIRKHGGIKNWNIEIIEHYPCKSKKQAFDREDYWIHLLNTTLNDIEPINQK